MGKKAHAVSAASLAALEPGVHHVEQTRSADGKFGSKPAGAAAIAPVVEDPEDAVGAMKRVLVGQASRTPLDQAFVELLSRDPIKFMAEKRRLESGAQNCAPVGPVYDPNGKERCPVCQRYPGTADPDDPITPRMSDDEVDAQIEVEFQEFQKFLAERRPSGSPPSPRPPSASG
jgi:hypothetical protein